MNLADDFFKEEIRNDHRVSELMKKVWYKEICILQEFDTFCKKHGLIYFVDYGTLLGAVRHKGFIPWDDDIDVSMPRPDYIRLLEIAPSEFKEPLFLWNTYSDARCSAFSKLMDLNTAAVEYPDKILYSHQGIFIDIFPLDAVNDSTNKFENIRLIEETLWNLVVQPEDIMPRYKGLLDDGFISEFKQLPMDVRQHEFEILCANNYDRSEMVNFFTDDLIGLANAIPKKTFDNIIYLPFEYIMVPAPADYDTVLKSRYGDYNVFVKGASCHEGIMFDPDRSYLEYSK